MKNNNHLKEEPLFAIGKIAESNNVQHYKTIGTIEPYSGDNVLLIIRTEYDNRTINARISRNH